MKIKLVANGSRPWHLWTGQWGLSFVIDDTVLFDTFCDGRKLTQRLAKSGVDASALRAVVISHDHWDHTGGLGGFVQAHKGLDVYLPAGVEGATARTVHQSGGTVRYASGRKELKEGVFLSETIMGAYDNKPLAEQYIALSGEQGLVLVVGCAHPGIVQMVQHAKSTFGKPVYGVVGGFHLFRSAPDDVRRCISQLQDEGVRLVGPTHCTGWRAERAFRRAFGSGYLPLVAGKGIELFS